MFHLSKNKGEYNLGFVKRFQDMSGTLKHNHNWYEEIPDTKTWYGRTIKGRKAGYYRRNWSTYNLIAIDENQAKYKNVVRVWFIGDHNEYVDFQFSHKSDIEKFCENIRISAWDYVESSKEVKAP